MSYPPPPPSEPDDSGSSTPPPPPPPPPPYGSAPPPPYGSAPPPPYGSAPPPPPGYGAPQGGYGKPGANQKALWSMILGILGLVCCVVASIAAIILGQQAKQEIAASGGTQTGEGQAKAGVIMGIIGCALAVIGLVLYAALAAAGA